MDIFNLKKIQSLEDKLKRRSLEIASLKSDLFILERENEDLKIQLGKKKSVAGSVRSHESRLFSSASKKAHKKQSGNKVSVRINGHTNEVSTNAVITAAVVSSSLDDSNASCSGSASGGFLSSDSSSSDSCY